MTKIIIERRSVLLFATLFVAAVVIAVGIIALLLTEFNIMTIISLLSILIFLSLIIPYARTKKDMMIIDDEGLTLNGNILFGPIPWDCISGTSISRIGFDKILTIQVTNLPKLENIFGETVVHQKMNTNKKTGEKDISFGLDLCKLRGIDIEKIIEDRAGSHKD